MHAEAGAADRVEIDEVGGEDRARELGRNTLLVHAVAGLVPDSEKAARQPILTEAAGDARVGSREGNLERMNRVVEPTALEVVPHASGHCFREGFLLFDWIAAFQNVDARRQRLQRSLEQRSDRQFQFSVQIFELRPAYLGLEGAARRIVGMVDIADMLADLALQRDGSLKHRREGGEIVL